MHRATTAAVDGAVAAERAAIVARLIRLTNDWTLAEDCVQDAIERALLQWPREGIPRSPAAWLTTVARHRALDMLRRRQNEQTKLQQLAIMQDPDVTLGPHDPLSDARLRLIFTCCHPAIALDNRVALTLKTVAGVEHHGDRAGAACVRVDVVSAAVAYEAEDRQRGYPLPGAS